MRNPFKRSGKGDATGQPTHQGDKDQAAPIRMRSLVVVGSKVRYPSMVIPQGPQGYVGAPPEEAGKEFTVVAIRFHWGDNPNEHDIIFEVEGEDGRRHRDVYYRFERPAPEPWDTVCGFDL